MCCDLTMLLVERCLSVLLLLSISKLISCKVARSCKMYKKLILKSYRAKGCKIGGSAIGAPHEIEEMLELTAKKGVKPWIQKRPLKEANNAVVDMDAGKARYRIVLVNEAHA